MVNPNEIVSLSTPTLPAEVLSTIFLHCADSDGVLDSTNTIDVPLLLTKICSEWRTVAIATQSLWSRLFLSIYPNSEHQSSLVATWLARSGACPLQIYIIWQTPPFLSSHRVLDIIVQHSHRWRNMFIYLPFPAFESLSPIRGNVPKLEELSLGTDDDLISPEVSDVFEVAPHLRSLECVNLNPDMFKFPWDHLLKIPIMAVSVEDCIDVLHRAEHLENGSFIYTNSSFWPPKSLIPLRHNNLRELAVLTSPFNEVIETCDLFKYLTLPHLRSLRICNVKAPFGTTFSSFLSRIESLETLYLRRIALSDEELLEALAMTPSLKHLTVLSAPTVTGRVLDQLIWKPFAEHTPGESPLLPKMETLELFIEGSMGSTFLEILESRWEVGSDTEELPRVTQLTKVNVTVVGDLEPDIVQDIETLAASGMVIIVDRSDGM